MKQVDPEGIFAGEGQGFFGGVGLAFYKSFCVFVEPISQGDADEYEAEPGDEGVVVVGAEVGWQDTKNQAEVVVGV